jgi:hypothetical protein
MESADARLLAPLVNHRFQRFAQAADAAMAMLEQAVPGTLMLGQLEPGGEVCTAIDVRGAVVGPLERGSVLPLAEAFAPSRNGSAGAGESAPRADGARAFLRRYETALERATIGRLVPVSASFGVEILDQVASSAEALEAAERRTRDSRPVADVEPDIHRPTLEVGS